MKTKKTHGNQMRHLTKAGVLLSLFIIHCSLFICTCEQPTDEIATPQPAYAEITNGTISGYKNITVAQKDFTITIANETLRTPIAKDADLTSWFTNLPAGLTVRSKALVPVSQANISISVSGAPLDAGAAQFAITIPEGTLGAWKALPVNSNRGARYNIEIPDATVEDVSVIGLPGTPIASKNIVITLYKGTFISTANASSWITNLPSGLSASLTSSNATTATITVSGTTNTLVNTAIEITLGSDAVSEYPLTVIKNPHATFEIYDRDSKLAFINDVMITGVRNFDVEIGLAEPKYRWTRIKESAAEIVITLNRDTFHSVSDISGWITNLPAGLTAALAAWNSDSVTINVSGYPTIARKATVTVTIPASVLAGGSPLTTVPNSASHFYIPDIALSFPRTAGESTFSRATISGTKGAAITPVDTVELTIDGDSLTDNDIEGLDITNWFANMPAGLHAVINYVSVVAGKTIITITISGTPGERKVEHIKVIVPSSFLKCDVDVEADPEISAKYIIAESAMTDTEMKEMVSITGGTVTAEPPYTYGGGESSRGFPREAGPFHVNNLPVTIPNFQIGKYEVTRQLWYEVYSWAIEHGYDFYAYSWSVPETDKKYFPMTHISCKEAVLWCNAYSEMRGKAPVYYYPDAQTIFRVLDIGTGGLIYEDIIVDGGANGFRVPTPALWEYAARGGLSSAEWNYQFPGTNNLLDVPRFAWVDKIRNYDSYNNEARVGLFEPTDAGLYDIAGNVHEWTVKTDSEDPSQTITRGGANNRDGNYCGFDWQYRTERRWSSSRDIIGFRVITMNN